MAFLNFVSVVPLHPGKFSFDMTFSLPPTLGANRRQSVGQILGQADALGGVCRMMASSVAAIDCSSRVADGAPDLVRCRRHFQVVNAERFDGIIDGIHYCGKAADSAAFPGSLDAQGIGFRRHRMAV